MRQAPKSLFAFIVFLLVSPTVLACMCPPDMAGWLRQADTILVVRIDSVASRNEDAVSGATCNADQPSCSGYQVAMITTVHSIKGNGRSLPSISSGYGGGDCGVPLIAGGYYVIFMRGSGHRVGSCNSAGPYIKSPRDSGPYPKQLNDFIGSLQLAMKDPKALITSAPVPRQLVPSNLK